MEASKERLGALNKTNEWIAKMKDALGVHFDVFKAEAEKQLNFAMQLNGSKPMEPPAEQGLAQYFDIEGPFWADIEKPTVVLPSNR